MAIDRERLEARSVYVRSQLAALKRIVSSIDAERFAAHPLRPPAARYHLQTAIEALIDIAFHLCAKLLRHAPTDAQDAFARLVAAGVLPKERAGKFREMLRFRNRVVHGYLDVDDLQVYRLILGELDDIEAALVGFEGAAQRAGD